MTQSINDFSTVVELLRYRCLKQLNTEAFTFLLDGEAQAKSLTYQELDRQSRAIAQVLTCQFACQLQVLNLTEQRALLLYPPGLDYLAAFFGCLYAGVVAVPAYPPRNYRNTPRILSILKDAEAAIVLTTTTILQQIQSLLVAEADTNLRCLTTDDIQPDIAVDWREPPINSDTLAFLQYTSGSTGTPKGVMLTHGNLIHNATMTYACMEHSQQSKFVTWLPIYHDMGLIGGVLQPLYGGFPCIMMSPASFLQNPYRWLAAISDYQGTTSGAPNFAYHLCVEKITPEQRATLDLSSWDVAFNGAEPIRQQTLELFSQTFADCGFRPQAFYPCYGMAEATLMVSGTVKSALPVTLSVEKTALEQHKIIPTNSDENIVNLVGYNLSIPGQKIVIVDLENCTLCHENEVGEIWVFSPSVGQGYWQRPEETKETFKAEIKDSNEGDFLRTGDLGFFHNGQLFITGRSKDLIIIRGRNLYPQDVELITENSHSALRRSGGAAFAIDVGNEEKLVIVQELEFRAKPDFLEVIAAIRQAVSQQFEIQVYAVVLIKGGTIPKTSSGKIQRRATKVEFLAGNLQVVHSSILNYENLGEVKAENIESYLQQIVSHVLSIPFNEINVQQPLSNLGIDSLQAFDLKNRIQKDLGVTVSAVDLFETSIIQIGKQILSTNQTNIQTIQRVSRNSELPLCLAQERLWFLDQLEPGNPFYNVAIAIRLSGKLDGVILESSLNEIIKRHESLRTTFVAVAGKPVQVIHESLEVKFSHFTTQENCDADIQSLILQETQKPFHLAELPLLRGKLLTLKTDEHLLIITIHHIIADGWSIGVLIQELATIYAAFTVNKPALLPELSIQYADYAYWQRNYYQSDIIDQQLNYWKQQLSNSAVLLNIPTDKPRPAIQTFTGKKEFFTIPAEIKAGVKKLNQQEGVTLFMTLLTVFKTLLYCYTKQEDILVGSPVVGRNWRETENLIGFFINTLVFRSDFSSNPSFRELLKQIRAVALDAYAHQDLPFEKLVEELKPERNLSYNPLFQVMFILQNALIPTVENSELTWQPEEVDVGTSKFDLKLSVWESDKGINGSFEYKTDLFAATTIKLMVSHYELILQTVIESPDIQVHKLVNIVQKQQSDQKQELQNISLQKLKSIKRAAVSRFEQSGNF
ncbi:AMP-binding protein [Anabaena sp. UHCC 0253]|uniref:condensation domain-containing protein n=1 Tax=Anabaena sp. UHCC 0253 TaxID=2590019 RepID=UPI00144730BB|nr:condensation domain-containing protein [Anabaena sp. UHCC 0253]MTJ53560.1 AMP-binding protein [Anabaena sp. UHCC 0253]